MRFQPEEVLALLPLSTTSSQRTMESSVYTGANCKTRFLRLWCNHPVSLVWVCHRFIVPLDCSRAGHGPSEHQSVPSIPKSQHVLEHVSPSSVSPLKDMNASPILRLLSCSPTADGIRHLILATRMRVGWRFSNSRRIRPSKASDPIFLSAAH